MKHVSKEKQGETRVEHLTDRVVEKLAPPKDGRPYRKVADDKVPRLWLRIMASGVKSWVINYSHNGVKRRHTIGGFPDWGVEAARDEAKRIRRLGLDPQRDRLAQREAPTVDELADRYLSAHVAVRNRASSRKSIEGLLRQWIRKELGKLKVADVRHEDCDRLHQKISKAGTPHRANRAMAVLSKMFSLAVKWEMRPDNPVKGVERNQEPKRRRYLGPDELRRLTVALAAERDQLFANAIRLLLFTGARRGEVLGATWQQFDFTVGEWVKPGATTKQKTEHRVPLSAPALQLLSEMREKAEAGASLLFPRSNGEAHRHLAKRWARICRAAGLAERVQRKDRMGKAVTTKSGKPVMVWQPTVRLHDLRHTHASILASNGLSLPVIGALLGHTQPSTTARYAHLFDDPLRQATAAVGEFLTGLANGKSAKVKEFPATKGRR